MKHKMEVQGKGICTDINAMLSWSKVWPKVARLYTIIFLSILTGLQTAYAQNIWYENSSATSQITVNNISNGSLSINVVNPNDTGINTNGTVTKFEKTTTQTGTSYIRFDLPNRIIDLSNFTFAFKIYSTILNANNHEVKVYLHNTQLGSSSDVYLSQTIAVQEVWEALNFDFTNTTMPDEAILENGYDQIIIALDVDNNNPLNNTFYIDTLESSVDIVAPIPVAALSGSWGVWYQMPGGIRLDNSAGDWLGGAQEIIDDLPSTGHVFLNFTHSAHGYFFMLRDNAYIDIAADIHPDMVPSLANEQKVLDVISLFKNAGKKVILYLATDGPAARGGTPDNATYLAAWQSYYQNSPLFTGTDEEKEGQAWRLVCKGFFERFQQAGVDGYWLDHVGDIIGDYTDFLITLKSVHPQAVLAANFVLDNTDPDNLPDYYEDEFGNQIYVDTDGMQDEDPTHYRVKDYNATDSYIDFTGGHPTPLAQGAPPNSWSYEELTHQEIISEPWTSFGTDGKSVLKHAFVPLRQRWSLFSTDLMFEEEQAYRFVRRLTDAGACITFSATLDGGFWSTGPDAGYISEDEMIVLREVDQRMQSSPRPDYIPYKRPIGAYYVGEQQLNQSVWNGTTSSSWGLSTNWDAGIPNQDFEVLIANDAVHPLEIDATQQVTNVIIEDQTPVNISASGAFNITNHFENKGSVVINSSASQSGVLIVEDTRFPSITYNRGGLVANKWSIISSPCDGQSIREFILNSENHIRINTTVTPNRYALAYYNDDNPLDQKWVYYTTDDILDDSNLFEKGIGYAVSTSVDGDITFQGDYINEDVDVAIQPNRWNAIGNPYTAYLPINGNAGENLIDSNMSNIDAAYLAIYIWDHEQNKYVPKNLASSDSYLSPGQGFFIKSSTGANTFHFLKNQRTTVSNSAGSFSRVNETAKEVELIAISRDQSVKTTISIKDSGTIGIDPGHDLGNFEGENLDIYTQLLASSKNIKLTRQTISEKILGNTSIPIGLKARPGEVEIKINKINIPEDIEVYLEDTQLNKLIKISNQNSYKFVLDEPVNGAGRFLLRTQ